jgi:hypothetical protein
MGVMVEPGKSLQGVSPIWPKLNDLADMKPAEDPMLRGACVSSLAGLLLDWTKQAPEDKKITGLDALPREMSLCGSILA